MSTALLLIGSPKPRASASRSFAEAVGSRLRGRGWTVRTERAAPALRDRSRLDALLAAVGEADLVVLSFPVYVDTLPAPVTRVLEAWADAATDGTMEGGHRRLAVLTQCGFPEARHCDVAVEVCRRFACEAGVTWAGALAFGMGGAIEGRPAERSPLARVVPQLDVAAAALADGGSIPASATEAFARPLVPAWVYPLFGAVMWRRQAARNGCDQPLTLRRYPQAV